MWYTRFNWTWYTLIGILFYLSQVFAEKEVRCCGATTPSSCGCPTKGCGGDDLCSKGCQQSPVNIVQNTAVDTDLPPLKFTNMWSNDVRLSMMVAGQTVLIKPPPECKMSVTGGPLSQNFILDQLHFHWGETDTNGTEHCIDNRKYALEAHFVYYNCQFGCVAAALGKNDGIAILSIICEVDSSFHNCHMDAIGTGMCKLKCPGAVVILNANVYKFARDIFETNAYFTYEGSLTTPPCSEKVIWLVFKCKAKLNCNQVAPFRKIKDACGKIICKNWRPVQPLNGRTIYNARATQCP